MNNRELDQIFRERLENFEMEPPMHLWGNIVEARAKTRHPWLLWSGAFSMLAVAACIGFWLMDGPAPGIVKGAFPVAVEEPLAQIAETAPATAATFSMPEEAAVNLPPDISVHAAIVAEHPQSSSAAAAQPAEEQIPEATEEQVVTRVSSFGGIGARPLSLLAHKGPKDGFPEKSCRPFSKEKWGVNWYVEAVGSPEYIFRSLTPKAKEYADYAEARQEMEEVRGGFSAGLRVSAVTDFGLSLRTGLRYSQVNEVLNFHDPDDIRIIVTNVYDGFGNIIGSDTIYEPGTHIRISYNRYRMVDVPVMLGYEFQFPRFSMTVHGGALFNLLFAKKGDILSPEGEPVAVSSSKANPYPAFRDRLGLSLAGSIGFNYRLTPDLQFVVEPQFRVVLDPVTRRDYPLQQDYFMTGITLGVRQKL